MKPAFLCKLVINYKNGTSREIISDTTWKYDYGPH
ncbi:MAG: alpha-L-rhamnosidase N-terminal domain-containing protein [Saprospiraceae bacterium]|nr:alpha-L-rhamnosidase N-terminal domain-containing protein [Saprospiraceae bacterium]